MWDLWSMEAREATRKDLAAQHRKKVEKGLAQAFYEAGATAEEIERLCFPENRHILQGILPLVRKYK